MSRGGGGRGRGGRFGGRGGFAQELIRDNLEDLGLDYADTINNNNDFSSSNVLYPPINLVHPKDVDQLSEKQLYIINQNNIITNKFQSSPYFASLNDEKVDIKRYSNSKKRVVSKVPLSDHLIEIYGGSSEEVCKYIPSELLFDNRVNKNKLTKKEANSKFDINLQKFETAEGTEGVEEVDKDKKKEGDEDSENIEGVENEDIDEFELDDDYGVDHYASDNEYNEKDFGDDDGDRGDHEATF